MTTPCLSSVTIASYVDRRLSQAEQNRADEHLATCYECLSTLANTVKTLDELKEIYGPPKT